MKRTLVISLMLLSAVVTKAQKQEITKTGLNFGPLPAVAYDADKGFQYGAILQIYDYGDGSSYPNYDNYAYLEYSRFTKGSQLIQFQYDSKGLIPGVRWCLAIRINLDKAFDFYGFNGYQSYYDNERITAGNEGQSFRFTPFYRIMKNDFSFKSDFLGRINSQLQWEAGIFSRYYQIGNIDYESINKGKDESAIFPEECPTLYSIYRMLGIISDKEAEGGLSSGLRLGLVYDSRDKEGAPSSGIWAEAHVTAALPLVSKIPYYRYSLTWRQYFPLIRKDVLTFAYRLNYEGNIGKKAPFYALPYMTAMGNGNDYDGMGGYNTTRGIMRTRVVGLDQAAYTVELRWRPISFSMFNQNFALGLSAFSDGCMATRAVDLGMLPALIDSPVPVYGTDKDRPHITFGSGLRFIMNENFIVALEYGTPLTHFLKKSPLYNQDGTGAIYINLGYTF